MANADAGAGLPNTLLEHSRTSNRNTPPSRPRTAVADILAGKTFSAFQKIKKEPVSPKGLRRPEYAPTSQPDVMPPPLALPLASPPPPVAATPPKIVADETARLAQLKLAKGAVRDLVKWGISFEQICAQGIRADIVTEIFKELGIPTGKTLAPEVTSLSTSDLLQIDEPSMTSSTNTASNSPVPAKGSPATPASPVDVQRRRKRPVAADFDSPVVPEAQRRCFGAERHPPVLIDFSDDEDHVSQSRTATLQAAKSTLATVQSDQGNGNAASDELRRKEEEIKKMMEQIARMEANKKKTASTTLPESEANALRVIRDATKDIDQERLQRLEAEVEAGVKRRDEMAVKREGLKTDVDRLATTCSANEERLKDVTSRLDEARRLVLKMDDERIVLQKTLDEQRAALTTFQKTFDEYASTHEAVENDLITKREEIQKLREKLPRREVEDVNLSRLSLPPPPTEDVLSPRTTMARLVRRPSLTNPSPSLTHVRVIKPPESPTESVATNVTDTSVISAYVPPPALPQKPKGPPARPAGLIQSYVPPVPLAGKNGQKQQQPKRKGPVMVFREEVMESTKEDSVVDEAEEMSVISSDESGEIQESNESVEVEESEEDEDDESEDSSEEEFSESEDESDGSSSESEELKLIDGAETATDGMQDVVMTTNPAPVAEPERPGTPKPKFTPYQSALRSFRSYRFHPLYASNTEQQYRSATYSHKIDPKIRMCLYETSGGTCNDDTCESQHFRDTNMDDNEILADLIKVVEGETEEERKAYKTGLHKAVMKIGKKTDKSAGVNEIAETIAEYRKKWFEKKKQQGRVLALS
ncbi:hypothetical protein SAICODRAFT_30555 [Saitoella complicata NRRL Y-17804]|uniref:Putative zinc-finger domain-containing protein n=1 Tax=Saitoella complicata (strain BCRC 22490 / CBS 7301 / JCM 7358 / NBRC 10748 / NRRL Y-17804) TaxID=698492 RepID=A0A0E9NKL1_SAICN|nr:uncharacterized protein SAICODRAFT_30555 [Saitoella complicata NRRL Y-17804]ODQ52756.1 hypothetical protein SAICODRAFT_30555 [Saitoella complicata NRRL Y-17804]GAO50358.1 hypothetical protein G7K_4485-t1 [Saitoella complicata NRRL Y-17804]